MFLPRKKKPSPVVADIIISKQRLLLVVVMSTSPIGRTIPTHVASAVSTGPAAATTAAAGIQRGVSPVTVTSTGATARSSGQEDLLVMASDITEMCRSEPSSQLALLWFGAPPWRKPSVSYVKVLVRFCLSLRERERERPVTWYGTSGSFSLREFCRSCTSFVQRILHSSRRVCLHNFDPAEE